jgi:hypothetical protein
MITLSCELIGISNPIRHKMLIFSHFVLYQRQFAFEKKHYTYLLVLYCQIMFKRREDIFMSSFVNTNSNKDNSTIKLYLFMVSQLAFFRVIIYQLENDNKLSCWQNFLHTKVLLYLTCRYLNNFYSLNNIQYFKISDYFQCRNSNNS